MEQTQKKSLTNLTQSPSQITEPKLYEPPSNDLINSNKLSQLVKILDVTFVPTSLLRLAYRLDKQGYFDQGDVLKHAPLQTKFLSKAIPYINVEILEAGRVFGYIKAIEAIFFS